MADLHSLAELKTVKLCASPKALSEFLRLSRKRSDDHVRSELSERSCHQHIPHIFDEWNRRDTILEYCEALTQTSAAAATHDDSGSGISQLSLHSRDIVTFRHTQIDPRVDSYGARDEDSIPASQTELVAQFLRNERATESIIRESTVDTILRRCGDFNFLASPDQFYRQYELSRR